LDIVNNLNKYGSELKSELIRQVSRQLLLAHMVEMMPEYSNRVTVNPSYKDKMGNLRPIISWTIPEYSLEGISFARQLSKRIFQRLGAEDHTVYDPLNYGYTSFNGSGYEIRGGNHLSGTHIMGTSKLNSVVNDKQRSWDFENLYLVGAGSMPTIGTANTSLTIAAITFMTAEDIIKQLKVTSTNNVKLIQTT
jgi:choline dehydrogenase-like flavoprotein